MYYKSHISKIVLLVLVSLSFVSCSSHRDIAYDFVKNSKGASVAFYVPKELQKANLRNDFDQESELFDGLDEEQIQDSIDSRVKILNKIDDDIFLIFGICVVISSNLGKIFQKIVHPIKKSYTNSKSKEQRAKMKDSDI